MGDSLVEQQGILKEGKRQTKSGYTQSTIRNQAKGKGGLPSCSPQEGRRVTSLNRTFQDLDGEGKETNFNKKQREVDFDDLTVKVRSQSRRQP